MRPIRVFSDEPLAPRRESALSPAASGHVLRVLRLRAGDALTLFDGRGGEYPARIVRAGKQGVAVVTEDRIDIERESPLSITLLQGLVRGEKMDWIVQKATELGIARIIPVATARSVMRIEPGERGGRKVAHWHAVAAAACEQCGRNRLPAIDAPMDLPAALAVAETSADVRLLLSPQGEGSLATAASAANVALLIGPEGGFEEPEVAAAVRHGFRTVQFGPRVLRTETAAIAALTALQVLAGDLIGAGVSVIRLLGRSAPSITE
ncbi:MAG: Ribosomal RNA small subunit methyltransferase E [Steroidobacteraceae bacterium]|nr:Ribosomal RNA small subunit methyltransferase E [Steroidobacteraceae bacterium]